MLPLLCFYSRLLEYRCYLSGERLSCAVLSYGCTMKNVTASRLLKDFISVVEGGMSANGKDFVVPSFACRPFTGITAERDTVVSSFKGEIGVEGLEDFKNALNDLVTDRLHKLIIDLRAISLSRTAVGTLVNFAASIYGRNKKLYLYSPSPQVRASLAELNLTTMFNVLETQEDILIAIFI